MKRESNDYLVIASLWLVVFASASQVMIIAPILPRIEEELGVVQSQLGLLMTVYAVAVGLFALISGPISDRYGRKRMLMVGSGSLALMLGLHLYADSFASLMTVRFLAGAAGGILSGAAVSYVGDYFPINKRGWASGWVMSGIAAGQIAGIPLGNLLASESGFRAPFLAFAILAAIAFLIIATRLPQPSVSMTKRLTFKGALSGYKSLLKQKRVRAAAAAFLMMFMGISLFVTYFPTWLEQELRFEAKHVSLLYVIGGIANVIVGPRAGRLSDRIGRSNVIIVSSIGVALIMPVLTFVDYSFSWTVYPLFFLTMALVASRMSPMQALLTQLTSGEQRGALMSLITSIGQIGFGLGSAFAAGAWGALGFLGNALLAMTSVLVMAWIVWKYLVDIDRDTTLQSSGAIEPSTVVS